VTINTENNDNLEVEVKLKVKDNNAAAIRKKLGILGFNLAMEESFEHNIVFDTEEKDLKKKHQLLRLRQVNNHTILTFKRPAEKKVEEGDYKIREELEIEVSDFETAQTILTGLGYEIVFIYEKYREVYKMETENGTVEIMIDRTPIGLFIEIEGSTAQIDTVAYQLGFEREDYITDNYRTLYRQLHPTGFMLFK
jgi:adenylate cyclase class 2